MSANAVWVVQHVAGEGPGLFGGWLQEDGIPARTLQPYQGEPWPVSLAGCRGLLVMGGPMNVDEVGRYPWLERETALIREVIAADLPVLGICLGAQLIAKAAGARVQRGAQPEIGWYDVESTTAAARDPLFAGFPARYTVFQWHGDTFDLPTGAVPLAQSAQYPHQAFRLGERVYALQYHLEVTPAIIAEWLDHGADPVLRGIDVAAIRARTPHCAPALEVLARQFYASWRILLP